MRNLANGTALTGSVYMVKYQDGETNSFRILAETPSHFIFTYTEGDSATVFEKAKKEIAVIYEVKEWWEKYRE